MIQRGEILQHKWAGGRAETGIDVGIGLGVAVGEVVIVGVTDAVAETDGVTDGVRDTVANTDVVIDGVSDGECEPGPGDCEIDADMSISQSCILSGSAGNRAGVHRVVTAERIRRNRSAEAHIHVQARLTTQRMGYC